MIHPRENSTDTRQEDHGLSPDLVRDLRRMVVAECNRSMMSMPAERVMRAVRVSPAAQRIGFVERELVNWFRPVLALGIIVIMALAVYNFDLSRQNDHLQTPAEMVLGLQPVTVAAAYDIEFDHHD
ncbi:MAG: hypothetical protein EBR20_00795 [Bacteroidetes bacterium]|jgi:hypothetical protein|nr:hypothetical protein [Bacteroidota bacterium]